MMKVSSMKTDKVDHFLKALNRRNGRAEATRLILQQGYGGKMTSWERDELMTCSRIANAKIGA